MARYTGPVCKLCRRVGEKLELKGERCSVKCALDRHVRPPGFRGGRRRKLSERGLQLRAKQAVRYTYGVLERQFRRYFEEAERRPGITGENLLQILELRLDNVVYRLGYADTRIQARQLVRHGHIMLNGRKTDIPSAILRPDDVVSWMPGSTKLEYYKQMARNIQSKEVPSWLAINLQDLSGRVLSVPSRGEIDERLNEQAIVGYYSR